MSVSLYCVYLDDVYVKAFLKRGDALTCASGIKVWLDKVGLDVDSVHIEEE